jgi:hypothetical protein
MATDKSTLKLALKIMKRLRRQWEMYLEDCEEWRKDGHRPHYCFHGTNQWTDYDNICGWCEEYGNYWNYGMAARQALNEATEAQEAKAKRVSLLIDIRNAKLPVEDWGKLMVWAHEPLAKYDEL